VNYLIQELGDSMKEKPDIEKVKQVAPEAENLEEIGSGGYNVVYKALVSGKIEALKLVQIPGDESDETIRDEHILPLLEGLRQFRERAEL